MQTEVDFKTSMVRIGRRWYPSVVLICPAHDDDDDRPLVDRTLIGGVEAAIPLENGAIIEIVRDSRDDEPCWEVYLVSKHCELAHWHGEPDIWIPAGLELRGRTVVTGPLAQTVHRDPDEEWLGEWIDRVSRLAMPKFDTPTMSFAPMAALPGLLEELRVLNARRRQERVL